MVWSNFQPLFLLGGQKVETGEVNAETCPGFRWKVAVKVEELPGWICMVLLSVPVDGAPVTTFSLISGSILTGSPSSYSAPSTMASKFSLIMAH